MPLPPPLAPFERYRRFITYRVEPDLDRPGKTHKFPLNPSNGWKCDPTDPDNQTDYATACAANPAHIGFVFNRDDGFWFLDIDEALQPDGATWSQLAQELCARLSGAAVEVSQSGRGLHVFGRGAVPEHSCKNVALGLEFYSHDRFVALTGTNAVGNADTDHSAAIAAIVAQYFPPNAHGDIAGWTDAPVDDWKGPVDDAELLRAAMASGKRTAAAAFGGAHVTFSDLWLAAEDALAKRWPGTTGGYDASHADAALAGHLAYWTGKNCERIRELMYQSGLAREKWDNRPDWLETTIMKACGVVKNVAQGRKPVETVAPDVAAAAGMKLRSDHPEFIGAADQLTFFQGCVYIVEHNKIWIPATGDLLDKARFDVIYGGHLFAVDPQNDKITDSAFDAFTRSRVFEAPRADRTCFRPECPPGAVMEEEGRRVANTYIPIETRRIAGDAGPFTRHMRKLFPDKRDRDIITAYMASVVRNPGRKMQWWPVIQGAEGNGKTLLSRVMTHAVGSRYSHLVSPAAMKKSGNQFNGWVQGNLFLGIEEIYIGDRRDFLDAFKETVTNDRVPLERKGVDQTTGDNRINGIMFTNHKEAVPITVDSRRYSIHYCPQQKAVDIERDGMGGRYFPDLYDWCTGRGEYSEGGVNYGYAIINDYLRTCEIAAEFDPAGSCQRAPRTSSTPEAIKQSFGRAEQEILEAIEEGRPGFCGGWVSSIAVDRLLDQIKAPIPRQKRADMLETLGYMAHPKLIAGRVNNHILPDNGRPRLFILPGHLSLELHDAAGIAKAYTNAQNQRSAEKSFGAANNA